MDKKLLDALNNLSVALDNIGQAMASKKEPTSPTAQALKSGNFIEQINQINQGVKELKQDSKKILANQQTILSMTKKGSGADTKTDAAEGLGKDKEKQKSIKEGLGVIMLMAVAVLALGIAFKIVGGVNFFSVIAISTAIVLLSIGFAKVHTVLKKVGFTPKDGINFVLAVVSMSIGIAASSWILSTVKPIGLAQFFTTLFIAGAFAIVGMGMNKMIAAFKGKSAKEIALAAISLPIILPAISIGIALASWALQLVKPISLAQFFTTLFIAGAFTVVAYGMNQMLAAFKGKNPKEIALAAISLPIILPAIAIGIAASSWALQLVKPISLAQFFTTLFIAFAFTVIAYGMNQLISAFKGKNIGEIVKVSLGLVLVLPAIALAIALSSWVLNEAKPLEFGLMMKMLVLGAILAGITLVLAPALKILEKVGFKTLLMGGLALVLVATAVMASSHILSFGKYEKFPSLGWTVSVALSMVAFGGGMYLLGLGGPVGLLGLLFGGIGALMVAGAIVGVSHILSAGKYDKGPTTDWASGVGLVMTVFGFSMLTLGTFILGTFGLGYLALEAGSAASLLIADTIVKSADIFRKGNFTGGPKKEWSEGVAMAIGAFSPVYGMLMANGIMKIFGGGGVGPDEFAAAIRTISTGIVDAANYFNTAKAAFAGGPDKRWAEGVGLAIGAFAPVYEVLAANSGWFKSGVSPEDMKKAIMTISTGIVDAANFFAGNVASFDLAKVPKKEWGEGVGAAIGAFAPIFKQMSADSGWFTSGDDVVESMSKAIIKISSSIIAVAMVFSKVDPGVWTKSGPTESWSNGIKSSMEAISGIYKSLIDSDIDVGDIGKYSVSLIQMSLSISSISKVLAKGDYTKTIPVAWMKNATITLMQFSNLSKMLTDGGGVAGAIAGLFNKGGSLDPISKAADGIAKLSIAYTKLANSLGKFSGVINTLDVDKLTAFKSLTGNLALLSMMDSELFSSMLDTLEERAGTFTDIVKDFEKQQAETPGTTVGKKPGGGAVATDKKSDSAVLGEKLDRIAASLADIQTVVGSSGSLKSYMDSLGKEANIGGNNNSPNYR